MLLVRTDASATIGVGHAMRCLALAEAWIDGGGAVTFAVAQMPAAVAQRIERTGARLETVQTTEDVLALARATGARHAIVDGYHLGPEIQSALADAGLRVLVIDDRGETATRAATLVLNGNHYATAGLYAALGPGPRLLVGSDYALLRREFRAAAASREVPARARRILVSFGGADVANLTPRAIEALAGTGDFDVVVIAGPANLRAGELPATSGIEILPAVDDMATQMRRSDLAVVAAGSTCWELAACGVPMIAVAVAENQRDLVAELPRLGIGAALGHDPSATDMRAAIEALANDVETRRTMSKRGPELIDGLGAVRACEALREAA